MATRRIKKTGSKIEPKSKKMPEITVTRMFDEMAKLKIQIKELDKKYKEFEDICFEEGLSDYECVLGKFKDSKRETWKAVDKCNLVKEMTVEVYKEHSTISKTGIINGIGTKGFNKMVKKGYVGLQKTSRFYRFTANK